MDKEAMIETFTNVGAGLVIAWILTFTVMPMWGFEATVSNTTISSLMFTVVALIRSYYVRLFFKKRRDKYAD